MEETMYVLATHGGARLLESVRAAGHGDFEAHELIDPDE